LNILGARYDKTGEAGIGAGSMDYRGGGGFGGFGRGKPPMWLILLLCRLETCWCLAEMSKCAKIEVYDENRIIGYLEGVKRFILNIYFVIEFIEQIYSTDI